MSHKTFGQGNQNLGQSEIFLPVDNEMSNTIY